ncbi:MAG: C39 family peptidase [Pseudomonas sp.]|uniref:C39 family peptidase n=1 Tax=Halopseudomonas laoshanensis TaxID=2268758 RepID=UPI001B7116B6|nr:C39 family peptidase [Pseudomonas sp.]MBQ0778867.1 C39 family peptidase [Pseudomonas sp.]
MKGIGLAIALALTAAPLITVQAQTAPKPFAALPNGALIYKSVTSMRERRFINLVEQETDFSCGAAALATLLNQAYGWEFTEADVIQGMLAEADMELVRTQGFSMLDMKRFAETIGLRARGYRIPPEQLEQVKVPAIVLIDVRGYKHFVVMQTSSDGWVYIGDPVLGHKKMPLEDFTQGWNGIIFAVIGPGYDRDNALLSPPEPFTAKHRLDRFRPVPDAELLDFGFIQSDFF